MAANSENFWAMNSLVLKFLTLPFRWGLIICFVVFIVFGSSMVTQGYFNSEKELNQEWQQMQHFLQNKDNRMPINVISSVYSYQVLHKIIFDWSKITEALNARSEEDKGYDLQQKFLLPHMDKVVQLDNSLKMVSIRLGYIIWFVFFTLLISIASLTDGLVARAIRKQNAARESAGLYHRAKYWRSGILWLSISVYLACPISISSLWLFVPSISFAVLVWLQAKYLKKYL